MQESIFHHTFENGLTLIAQPMPWLESAAFSFAVPAGCRFDPEGKIGLANFVCEMVQRGCGDYDSRQFIEALESLGVDYSSSASLYNTNFSGAMQAAQLHDALAIYANVFRHPTFPDDQLEDGRMVCYQEIAALGDDLGQRTLRQLRTNFYGETDGRHCEGTMESVGSLTMDDIKEFHKSLYRPNGMIIACAGKLDWETLKSHVGQLFDDWAPKDDPNVIAAPAKHGVEHIKHESEQTHIGIAYPGVAYSHDDYYLNRGAIGVLSGGMSSRLFTEVREVRGLCYTVFASCHTLKDKGAVLCYSGTSNDRAQETLDVIIEELQKLAAGIQEDELRRLKVQIRSGLIMQQESSRSRAGSIAGDWFHLGRVRTLDEVNDNVNGLTVESINKYLADHPPSKFDIVTLGPEPLKFDESKLGANTNGV
ncbi:MAG: M16 family metallopeptidase [Mariniblastus sp.]